MSRFGLVAQTIFQLSAAVFLLWNLLQRKWKYSTGVESKNAFEIVARISELAVALWFPCVLWNCVKPKELWILNPRKIIKTFEEEADEEETTVFINAVKSYNSISGQSVRESTRDCWICYDVNRKDAGPMIFPCQCKGDVAAAHQECLKRWLMELSLIPVKLHLVEFAKPSIRSRKLVDSLLHVLH
ncbi:uncharacterized protein LOC124438229 [Xenia sp. Carnegie-2017]|uniref:uncharacterized protein LOC124438229 n=1 Tax=Xenia sp. Carnegie-2017 TaxID=2897299 RepID=UPI001F040BF8|nr:uncharacterized protein LOC124438229 [Xenia sp. Carnegie-2017]